MLERQYERLELFLEPLIVLVDIRRLLLFRWIGKREPESRLELPAFSQLYYDNYCSLLQDLVVCRVESRLNSLLELLLVLCYFIAFFLLSECSLEVALV